MDEVAASCISLVKIYRTVTSEVHALRGIDASFVRGSVVAVVGPSGSGKSSLLRILAGMDRPTAGSVAIAGRELGGIPERHLQRLRRKWVGYVFQRPSDNLVADLDVAQHMALTARLRGLHGRRQADELLEAFGVIGRLRHRPRQLSGGEQQRVAFAQALLGRPAIVLADEPTAELDSASSRALLEVVRKRADRGAAFVVATHDPLVVKAADTTMYLRHGTVEAETRGARMLSVIDASGRIQLPEEALKFYEERRAVIEVGDNGRLEISPPEA